MIQRAEEKGAKKGTQSERERERARENGKRRVGICGIKNEKIKHPHYQQLPPKLKAVEIKKLCGNQRNGVCPLLPA